MRLVKPMAGLVLGGFFLCMLTQPATARIKFVKDLVNFSKQASAANECMLFSAHFDSPPIRLLEKPAVDSLLVHLAAQGAPCKILEKSYLENGDTWYQIELASENKMNPAVSGWVAYKHVVTVASVRPLDAGKKVLLTFRPICEKTLCSGATWVVSNFYQRELPIGQEPLYVDSKGENFIYKREIKKVSKSKKGRSPVSYETVIFRYNLRNNAFKILGVEGTQMTSERFIFRGSKRYTEISTPGNIVPERSGLLVGS